MVDSEVREQKYCCEDCNFFDNGPVPSECRKDHGRAAYFHQVCEDFQLQIKTE